MPRKSPYERLIGGIRRTKKQTSKMVIKHHLEEDACVAINAQLTQLEESILGCDSQAMAPAEWERAMSQHLAEFKRIKTDWKIVKARTKPQLKAARAERKQEKARNKQILETCRLTEFPNDTGLTIIVDGWNVMGALLKGRGRSKSKMQAFLNGFAAHPFVTEQGHSVTVMFDGGGSDRADGQIFVRHSGTDRIVDDLLVEEFGQMAAGSPSFDGSKFVVATSDRGLTLRLHALGVQVMKGGTFVRLVRSLLQVGDEEENKLDGDEDGDVLMGEHIVTLGEDDDDEESSGSASSAESD